MTILGIGTETPAGPGNTSPDRTARKLEGLFFQILVRELRRSIPQSGLLAGGLTGRMATDLFDQAVAEQVGGAFNLGLADTLCAQLGQAAGTSELPVRGRITSGYGPRKDPFTGERKFHHGLDIGAPAGRPIHSISSGTVTHAGHLGGLGNTVRVRRGDDTEIIYGHCGRLFVRPGQHLDRGARLAEVGQSGRATGPHLHLEVRSRGKSVDPRHWRQMRLGLPAQDLAGSADGDIGVLRNHSKEEE